MFTLLSKRRSSYDQQQAIKMGWLDKQSKHLHVFKKRWIEAYFGDKLCSFPSSSVETPTEIIDLSDMYKAYPSNNFLNEFIITYFQDGSIKSRRFRASTEKEANQWIKFFNQTIDIDHKCARCQRLDKLIMSTLHINNSECEYRLKRNSINNNKIKCHQRTKTWIQNPSISIKLIEIDDESLIDYIEEIAFDVEHNQQYLQVVLESDQNDISRNNSIN